MYRIPHPVIESPEREAGIHSSLGTIFDKSWLEASYSENMTQSEKEALGILVSCEDTISEIQDNFYVLYKAHEEGFGDLYMGFSEIEEIKKEVEDAVNTITEELSGEQLTPEKLKIIAEQCKEITTADLNIQTQLNFGYETGRPVIPPFNESDVKRWKREGPKIYNRGVRKNITMQQADSLRTRQDAERQDAIQFVAERDLHRRSSDQSPRKESRGRDRSRSVVRSVHSTSPEEGGGSATQENEGMCVIM
jgi:hypothetical protein